MASHCGEEEALGSLAVDRRAPEALEMGRTGKGQTHGLPS